MSTISPPGFTQATVGKKVLMAITGVSVIGFLVIHLLGNLQIFIGQAQLNKYAETLQSLGTLKWAFRSVIALFFAVHIWEGLVLWLANRKARPVSYTKETTLEASIASRTMIYTGIIILLFVAYHLLHFTLLSIYPEYQHIPLIDGHFDVYSMVILGFSKPIISAIYIAAIAFMAFHLSHASSSFFQTLGLTNPKILKFLKVASNLFSIIIFIGYASIPLAVLMNIITLTGGGH